MKKLASIILIITVILLSFNSFAQQAKIDSLENLLKTATQETTRINTLNSLCWEQRLIGKYEKALEYGKQALKLAKKTATSPDAALAKSGEKGIATAFSNIGNVYYNQSDYSKALEYFLKSLEIMESLGDKRGMAASYNNIGGIYDDQRDYPKALEYFLKCLEIIESLGDKWVMAASYNNIGGIYYDQSDYPKALEYFLKCLGIMESLGNKQGMATSYTCIGLLYTKVTEAPRDSLLPFFAAEGITKENYTHALLDSARSYQLRALAIQKELGDKLTMTYSLNGLGDILSRQQQWQEALRFYEDAAVLAEDIGAGKELYEAYKNLATVYKELATGSPLSSDSKLKYYKKAYEYHEKYAALKDSIFNEESTKQIAEMQTKYETEKKEKQIEIQNLKLDRQESELKRSRTLHYAFVFSLVLLSALAFLLYNRYKIKQKANAALEDKNVAITRQKLQIEEKNKKLWETALMVNKEKEKVEEVKKLLEKKNTQMTDSITYAKQIQQAILVKEEEIQKHLPDSFIFFRPMHIVSGDFYWFSNQNGKSVIAAVDCTGHGVPGAFMSIIGNTLLNEIVNVKHITNPAEILKQLHIGVLAALHQTEKDAVAQDGMDIAIAVIDKEKMEIQFAGAKNPLFVIHNHSLEIIKADIYSIGGISMINESDSERDFTEHSIPINKNTSLYIFSDGYMDQFREGDRKKFGSERFRQLLLDIAELDMKQQKTVLSKTMDEWQGSHTQIDDMLVIGFKV